MIAARLIALALLLLPAFAFSQNAALVGEAEAQKCEDKIANVQRDVLGKYEDALQELQVGFQKAADLDNALAVRAEKERVRKEQTLTETNLVNEPKSLRAAQSASIEKIKELTAQLVSESVPRLVEVKKSLTIAGKLDDALAVRKAIERLQNGYVPVSRAEAGAVVTADTLLVDYGADRARADKIYKGQRIVVRGVFGGSREDAKNPKVQLVYLTGGAGGWVQCEFSASDFRFRDEQQFGASTIVISPKGNDSGAARLQKGQTVEIRGVCEGLDEVVRVAKCDLVR